MHDQTNEFRVLRTVLRIAGHFSRWRFPCCDTWSLYALHGWVAVQTTFLPSPILRLVDLIVLIGDFWCLMFDPFLDDLEITGFSGESDSSEAYER